MAKEHPRYVAAKERFDAAPTRTEFQGGRAMRCGECGQTGQAVETFRRAKDRIAYHLEFTCPNGHTVERYGAAEAMPGGDN